MSYGLLIKLPIPMFFHFLQKSFLHISIFIAIQCDSGSEYSACVDPCPEDTCEKIRANSTSTKECKQLTCVEGQLLVE